MNGREVVIGSIEVEDVDDAALVNWLLDDMFHKEQFIYVVGNEDCTYRHQFGIVCCKDELDKIKKVLWLINYYGSEFTTSFDVEY